MKTAIFDGELKIGGLSLKIAILDSGERVIEAESFALFLDALAHDEVILSVDDGKKIAEFIHGS